MHFARPWFVASLAVLSAFVGQVPSAPAAEKAGLPNPFFAYCVGIGTGKEDATLQAQLQLPAMLAEFGYSGMAYVGLNGALDMMKALEQHGQKLTALHTKIHVAKRADVGRANAVLADHRAGLDKRSCLFHGTHQCV